MSVCFSFFNMLLLARKEVNIVLNQAVLVGRIVREPELKETEKGKVTNITLAVPRSFKNQNGEYDTDFISCVLWKGVAESTVEYCKKGDLVGTWFPDRQYKGKSCILPLIYNINLIIYHNLLFVNK